MLKILLSDKEFMQLAIAKAREGIKKGQTPFGACIVKKGQVVSCAYNVVWKSQDITAHAEINCIRRACRELKTIDLSGCVIYSTCEPCPMCFSACHWAKINKIFFGAGIRDAKKAGFNEMMISNTHMKQHGKSHVAVTGGLLKEESLCLFEEWLQKRDKKFY